MLVYYLLCDCIKNSKTYFLFCIIFCIIPKSFPVWLKLKKMYYLFLCWRVYIRIVEETKFKRINSLNSVYTLQLNPRFIKASIIKPQKKTISKKVDNCKKKMRKFMWKIHDDEHLFDLCFTQINAKFWRRGNMTKLFFA